VAIGAMDAARFQDGVVGAARVAVYLAAGALALAFLLARLPRAGDRRALARHLERRDPSLDALLLTAVEVGPRGAPGGEAAPGLAARLCQRAAAACDDPGGATRDDRRRLHRAGWAVLALLATLAVALWLAGPGWRHGAMLLAVPWAEARAGMPYTLAADPGDVTVTEGSTLVVRAVAGGFEPQAVTLAHRAAGEAEWTRVPLGPGEEGRLEARLPSLAAPLDYHLEAESVRSPRYRVELRWLPRLERLDHLYRYPDYTGLAPRTVEGGTDIAAVSGTGVELRVRPQSWPASGELVLDGERRRTLAVAADEQVLLARLEVDEAGRYRVELRSGDGELVPVTPEHAITALPDGAPVVSVVRPAGEARVTPVEEVEVAVRADDDVSLRRVELVLSVNGGPEEVVELDTATPAASATGLHTLALEDRTLAPGDLVAFHARASDGVVARTAVSDIHFLEVRPFDRDYSRGRAGGGGGGGAGQGDQNLAAQQRDLVVALFRLARDRERLPEQERSERLGTLAEAQARIRERVEAIVRRLRGRAMVQATPGYQTMLEAMPKATAAMLRVEALLAVPDPDAALPPAREALSHLQRADAAFREVQVAARQQGGGGQGRADNNDLSRLFELEIDRFRNRYSQVQRSRQAPAQQQVDEALERLEELARRQRQEVERARRRLERDDLGGGAPSQQALAGELEELLRRLERLSRERPAAALDAARSALEQAREAMRESAAAGGSQAAEEALERLRQAREELAGEQPQQVARALEEARRRAESLAERQQQVRERLAGGDPRAGADQERGRLQGGGPRGSQSRRDGTPQRATRAGQQPGAGPGRQQAGGAQGGQQSGAAQGGQQAPQGGAQPGGRPGTQQAAGGESRAQGGGPRAGAPGGPAQPRAGGGAGEATVQGGPDPGPASLDELKGAMEADAQALREQLDAVAAGAAGSDATAEAARGARRAAGTMREEDVEGRLRRSREQLAAGIADETLEQTLADSFERVREQVARAAEAAAQGARRSTGEGSQPPSPQELRELMRELAGLREQVRRGARGDGRGPGGRGLPGLDALAGSLDRLRGPVADNYGAVGDLEALLEGIRALAAESAAGGSAGGPDTEALLEALAGVERALARAAAAAGERPVAADEGRAPERYRALVDDYYRRLSERATPGAPAAGRGAGASAR